MIRVLRGIANHVTRFVGLRWGAAFPFYYVCEYPKSGGTWLGQMIGDYLQIPFPRDYVFPIGFRAVIHSHWTYSQRLRPVFYLYRDGRDVTISTMFHVYRTAKESKNVRQQRYLRRRYRFLSTGDFPEQSPKCVLDFLEDWFQHPIAAPRVDWGTHVRQWVGDRPGVVTVSYEELRNDCASALTRVLSTHLQEPVDPERVAATVEKFSFRKQTKREPGQEDHRSFLRKGIVGDWRNHFTRDAGELFHERYGDLLVRLGYEKDGSWYKDLPS